MFRCLYGCQSGMGSTQEYHVYPLSASTIDLRLEKGVVCDNCNAYFSKLEKYFTDRHPGACYRVLAVKETRKGKPPRFEHQDGCMSRVDNGDETELTTNLASLDHRILDNGDILVIGTYAPRPFESVGIGRVLAKIALEYLIHESGNPEFDPYSDRFDPIRRYARFGPGKLKYLWFAWKQATQPQTLPRLIHIQDEGSRRVASLCRISLPGVSYFLPLPPIVAPEALAANLTGWSVVSHPGETALDPVKVEIVLNRKPGPAE